MQDHQDVPADKFWGGAGRHVGAQLQAQKARKNNKKGVEALNQVGSGEVVEKKPPSRPLMRLRGDKDPAKALTK